MQTAQDQQKREKKTSYYVTQAPINFKTKKEVEEFLNKEGGLKAGQVLVKGSPIDAQKKSMFKI